MGWFKRTSETQQDLRMRAPVARKDELAVEQVGDQVLIYDQRTNQAHCLSAAAGKVWRACDGTLAVKQLGAQLELDAGTVERALRELQSCGLLDGVKEAGVTRREATTRLAKVGAAAAAAPLIYSIVSPVPAAAQSLAACEAVNFVAGHDCGNQTTPHLGCGSVAGCCCCHGGNTPSFCTGDPQHCCVTAAYCANVIMGNTCSNGSAFQPAPSSSKKNLGPLQPNNGSSGGGGTAGGTAGGASNAGGASPGTGTSGTSGLLGNTPTTGTP